MRSQFILSLDTGGLQNYAKLQFPWHDSELKVLSSEPYWFQDGSFKTTPPLFTPLYTINGIRSNESVPRIFTLTPNKEEEAGSYNFGLRKISIRN